VRARARGGNPLYAEEFVRLLNDRGLTLGVNGDAMHRRRLSAAAATADITLGYIGWRRLRAQTA
jgi:hypothetical protein